MIESGERYSRQMRFAPIGHEGQQRLQAGRALIVGMGALGNVIAQHLVRAGVGFVRIVDRDVVEASNLQRQMLFDEDDVYAGAAKAAAAERKLRSMNSSVEVEAVVSEFGWHNAEQLAAEVDVVLDGTDNVRTRAVMNDVCYKLGIPLFYGGVVGSRGMAATVIPGCTPCLGCLIDLSGTLDETCATAGVLSMAVDWAGSLQSAEAIKWLCGKRESVRGSLLSFDLWNFGIREMKLPRKGAADCPTCALKLFPHLEPEESYGDSSTEICGSDTVQFKLGGARGIDLDRMAERLEGAAAVTRLPYLVRAELAEGVRFVLFADGRTLVQGAGGLDRARVFYREYIGG